jgi:hypothetical protein
MNAVQLSIAQWIPIVRGEFQEFPEMHLTKSQVQRLWSLDARTCDALLSALIEGRFLRCTSNGSYARADAGC